jgi:hypothetical protein
MESKRTKNYRPNNHVSPVGFQWLPTPTSQLIKAFLRTQGNVSML